jgi:hypothetical protein
MAYITKGELKTYLGLTGSNFDLTLERLAEASAEACDVHTGRTSGTLGAGFLTHSIVSEKHILDNEPRVLFGEWPVQSVTSATLRGVAITENTDYYLRGQEGILTFIDGSDHPKDELGPVFLNYVAGFNSVPNRVRLACLRISAYWFVRAESEGMGAQLIGDLQETYRIPEVERILDEELRAFKLDTINPIGRL